MARQAHGAVVATYGETVVLATVLSAPPTREINFFPLYVDYREAQYAGGKIPGGFFKREGRPTSKEILTMRMIDRPIRPLFPEDFMNEVQIQCLVLSTDLQNDPDTLAMIASSAALTISHAPFQGPLGVGRVGYVDGNYVLNPTCAELNVSDMDLVVAGHADGVNMIELGGREVAEDVVTRGVEMAYDLCLEVVELINELAAQVPVEKQYEPTPLPEELVKLVNDKAGSRIREAKQIASKVERNDALRTIRDEVVDELCPDDVEEPEYSADAVKTALYKLEGKVQRQLILEGIRPDGRGVDEVRPLSMETGVLPRTHGSALFARGETQTLATTTLGTIRDEQIVDGLMEEYRKKFMLHYNFPPFSVGEVKPIRGPGRREIGHGALAEKSLEAVLPNPDKFPYTIRLVSDIMESNGSTSMATVCGGSLALMDAGVPITAPVAGISVGMVSDGDKYLLLTDIIGEEDFHGDMDFKVAGTTKGITGIQLDLKARGITQQQIVESIEQARQARLRILEQMNAVLGEPREKISEFAPRMLTIKIDPQKIGKVIGPGGKMINKIQDETGAKIDIDDDGTIFIASVSGEGAEAAKAAIEGLTEEVQVGRVYTGRVVSIRDFGAFIEIIPGTDGLCHVSELDVAYVKDVTDVVNVGDEVRVKVILIDDQGRVKLSRKELLIEENPELAEQAAQEAQERRDRGEGGGDRGGERRGGRSRRGGGRGRGD
jgi:polyribonucleotide nucleotidyltransferase